MSNRKTLLERIDILYDTYVTDTGATKSKSYFVADVLDIIERAINPDGFCERCDFKLIGNTTKCINCGNIAINTREKEQRNNDTKKSGSLPKNVASLIEDVDTPAQRPRKTDQITKLKAKMDGSSATHLDKEILEAQDPALGGRDVTWV